MEREKIKVKIEEYLKNKNFSVQVLNLITDYLFYLIKLELLPEEIDLNVLLERLDKNINNIILFETKEQKEYTEIANNTESFKGVKINNSNNLYIRVNNQDWEIVFFHELTHALQGIGLKYNNDQNKIRGSLENEVITQYVADLIYTSKYNLSLKMKEYNSENLRMLSGITIHSDLTNYQHFDDLFNSFLVAYNLSRKDMIKIMFMDDENITKDFFSKIVSNKENLEIISYAFEYIYVTDKQIYTAHTDVENIDTKEVKTITYRELLLERGLTWPVMYRDERMDISAQTQLSLYSSLISTFKNMVKNNEYTQTEEISSKKR